MLEEVRRYLRLKDGDTAVDCTLGGGGYTSAMAETVGKTGRVLAIDADEKAIKKEELRIIRPGRISLGLKNVELPKNIILIHDNFRNLKEIITARAPEKVNGVVFDLGLSSAQLNDDARGFSFNSVAPLDMSYEGRSKKSEARDNNLETDYIVNKWDVERLRETIRNYGEERFAGRIARAIVQRRPLTTTKQLAAVIVNAVPKSYEHGRIHPATRTFQALRIATNDELESLREALAAGVDALKSDGRIVVVTFHSLEDRIVKQFFKQASSVCRCAPEAPVCVCGYAPQLRVITKKIVRAGADETASNPRSRSAKLRAAEKL